MEIWEWNTKPINPQEIIAKIMFAKEDIEISKEFCESAFNTKKSLVHQLCVPESELKNYNLCGIACFINSDKDINSKLTCKECWYKFGGKLK